MFLRAFCLNQWSPPKRLNIYFWNMHASSIGNNQMRIEWMNDLSPPTLTHFFVWKKLRGSVRCWWTSVGSLQRNKKNDHGDGMLIQLAKSCSHWFSINLPPNLSLLFQSCQASYSRSLSIKQRVIAFGGCNMFWRDLRNLWRVKWIMKGRWVHPGDEFLYVIGSQ